MSYISSQMMWVASCLRDDVDQEAGCQPPRKERLAQIEQSHNKDTPKKFPTILSYCLIVKIRSEGTK